MSKPKTPGAAESAAARPAKHSVGKPNTAKAGSTREPAATRKSGAAQPRMSRADTLIALMRAEGGAAAAEMAAAVGWQLHSVRGFVAGTVKKRSDLRVTTRKADGFTRYTISDATGSGA